MGIDFGKPGEPLVNTAGAHFRAMSSKDFKVTKEEKAGNLSWIKRVEPIKKNLDRVHGNWRFTPEEQAILGAALRVLNGRLIPQSLLKELPPKKMIFFKK